MSNIEKSTSFKNILLPIFILNLVLVLCLGYFYYRDLFLDSEIEGEGCVPVEVAIEDIERNSVSIRWQTAESCTSFVKLSDSIDVPGEIVVGDNGYSASTEHNVELSGLKPGTTYYLIFVSDTVEYGDKGKPYEIKTLSF